MDSNTSSCTRSIHDDLDYDVMALLEPGETTLEDFKFELGPNEGVTLEEQLAHSSPCSDSNDKDTDSDTDGDGAGEIDEGFVDEYCETEEPLAMPRESQQDLTSQLTRALDIHDIQQILDGGEMDGDYTGLIGVPSSSFLDDFDLGVDVLDSEQMSQIEQDYTQPLKSPPALVPGSPHLPAAIPIHSSVGMGFPSSTCSPELDLNSYNHLLSQDDRDLSGSYAEYTTCNSASMGVPSSFSEGGKMDVFYSNGVDVFDAEFSGAAFRQPRGSPSPSVSSTTSSIPPKDTLTGLMLEHTQFINLSELSRGELNSLLPIPGSTSPSTPVHGKSFDFGRSALLLPTDPNVSGIKWEGGGGSAGSCSRVSQTRMSPSPSPSPSPYTPSSPFTPSSVSTLSPGTLTNVKGSGSTSTDEKLVEMPYYQFRKILDHQDVSEKEKSVAKTIRRRGKNKIAAKNCRQRKLNMIDTLQNEIDKLRVAKVKFEVRVRNLQQEIEAVKKHCIVVQRNGLQS